MKKLLLALQIIGFIAICPAYVALEMTHATNGIQKNSTSSFVTTKTENANNQVSPDAKK